MAPPNSLSPDMSSSSLLRSDGLPREDYDLVYTRIESPASPFAKTHPSGIRRMLNHILRRPLRATLIILTFVVFCLLGMAKYLPEEHTPAILKSPFDQTHKWWAGDDNVMDIEDEEDFDLLGFPVIDHSGKNSQPEPVVQSKLGADLLDAQSLPSHPTDILLPQHPLPPPAQLLRPITDRLPYPLLSYYFSQGIIDRSVPMPQPEPMDVVFLWVNASGEYFQDTMQERSAGEYVGSRGRGKRYRDNGEVRGAIRSAIKSLGDRLGTVHVLSGDYEINQTLHPDVVPAGASAPSWHMGQIPHWLNWNSAKEGLHKVAWHFHSSIWRLPADNKADEPLTPDQAATEEAWRQHSLPNFNSFAIESRIGWINGLSETFLLANDDMFFLNSLNHADFQHPLLGTVLRMDPGPGLRVKPVVTPDLKSSPGEWGGLQHAAMLIKNRFTDQKRMYMAHMPKALTLSLTHEASVMFGVELSEAATRGFRQSQRGVADVEMSWLVSHLRIERWREGLLWTWVVARLGGQDGIWGKQAKAEMSELLGINSSEIDEVIIEKGPRETLADLEQINKNAGWDSTEFTKYYYSSFDGTVPQNLPERPDRPRTQTECTFRVAQCLPPDFFESDEPLDAAEMFRHFTFSEPSCGDCLIMALVSASGPRGLEAFFPDPDAVFHPPAQQEPAAFQREEPMLPLTPSWVDTDFRIESIMRSGQDSWPGVKPRMDGSVNMRQWCIKLLSRYAYVFAWTQTQFFQIHSTIQLRTAVNKLDSSPRMAMTCINDDQPDIGSVGVSDVFGRWMESRWGDVEAGWEEKNVPWAGSAPK